MGQVVRPFCISDQRNGETLEAKGAPKLATPKERRGQALMAEGAAEPVKREESPSPSFIGVEVP